MISAWNSVRSTLLSQYKLRPVALLICSQMIIMFIMYAIQGIITRGESILDSMFLDHRDMFMDFFNSISDSCHDPYGLKVIYPPLAVSVFQFIGHITIPILPAHPEMSEAIALRDSPVGLMIFFLSFAVGLLLLKHMLNKQSDGNTIVSVMIILLQFFSYPVLFAVERGNIVLFAAIMIGIYCMTYDSEKKNIRILSYVCLALACSIKLYLAVFGILLLRQRKWRETGFAIVLSLLLFLLPFLIVGGNPIIYIQNLNNFSDGDPTIFHLIMSQFCDSDGLLEIIQYLATGFCLLSQIALVLFLKDMEKWELLFLVPFIILLLSPANTSAYFFIYLLLPTVMYACSRKRICWHDVSIIVCLQILFSLFPAIGTFDYVDIRWCRFQAFVILEVLLIALCLNRAITRKQPSSGHGLFSASGKHNLDQDVP